MADAVCSQHVHDLLVRVVLVFRTSHFDHIVAADGIDSPCVAVVSAMRQDAASQFRLSIGQRSIVADLMKECQAILVDLIEASL